MTRKAKVGIQPGLGDGQNQHSTQAQRVALSYLGTGSGPLPSLRPSLIAGRTKFTYFPALFEFLKARRPTSRNRWKL
jgi:hypothetical protein